MSFFRHRWKRLVMKRKIFFTIGICLMVIVQSTGQVNTKEFTGKTNIIERRTPDGKPVIKKSGNLLLKRNLNSETRFVHTKQFPAVSLLYPGISMNARCIPASDLLLVKIAAPGEKNMAQNNVFNITGGNSRENTTGLSKLECGLDTNQGLSIGISGSACISLDYAGYFSNATDLTTNPHEDLAPDTENSINTGLSDSNITIGFVLEIR